MSARKISIASLVVLVLSAAPVPAQENPPAGPVFGDTSSLAASTIQFEPHRLPAPPSRRPLARSVATYWLDRKFAAESDPKLAVRTSSQHRNWIKKHPAKFGALAGAAIGTVPAFYVMATCPPTRSCSTAGAGVLFGATVGAAIGAGAGWMISQLVR